MQSEADSLAMLMKTNFRFRIRYFPPQKYPANANKRTVKVIRDAVDVSAQQRSYASIRGRIEIVRGALEITIEA
jgi:hypothetical protein